MLTVLESITLSTDFLEKKGIESPRMNAELLLAEILNCKRLDLYLAFDRPLVDKEIVKYREFISRRGKFEPLQYILGKVEFYGLEFKVNRSVLIPRQETEILIDTIKEGVNNSHPLKILDIGCGSGNISITLAKNLTNSTVLGIDISKEAIETALINMKNNDCEKNVEFNIADIMDVNFANSYSGFDIIVSNPPYVSESEYQNLQKEIINYEPPTAVTDGNDGYKFYRRISEVSAEILNPNGKLYFEAGAGQAEKIKTIMTDNGFTNIRFAKDYLGIDRVIHGEKL
ncbi:MAG: peptide chain release factor N(5)-glutamine methyltransferase [Bacteroidetes bacterium]|nr:peptide chain release factor N(5)-glutamine methyltransferase [Bacteroidota bacterium]